MGNCCGTSGALNKPLTEAEKQSRREIMAAAAEERSNTFKQGGGGESLKAKSKKLEEAERKNREAPIAGLNNPRAWD